MRTRLTNRPYKNTSVVGCARTDSLPHGHATRVSRRVYDLADNVRVTYNSRQLAAITLLGRRLLGLEP